MKAAETYLYNVHVNSLNFSWRNSGLQWNAAVHTDFPDVKKTHTRKNDAKNADFILNMLSCIHHG